MSKAFKTKPLARTQPALTDDDEPRRLEELLVVPGGMLRLQDVAHPVVLPQPQRGVHSQTGKESEHLVADGDLVLGGYPGWVVHPDGDLVHSGWVHLAVDQLLGEEGTTVVRFVSVGNKSMGDTVDASPDT